jgi:hypothetical protein
LNLDVNPVRLAIPRDASLMAEVSDVSNLVVNQVFEAIPINV